MRAMQIFAALFAVVGLIVVMQFPDRADSSASAAYQAMPPADLKQSAEAEWAAGRRGEALHLLEYVIQSRLPDDMAVAAGMREKYFHVLSAENTPASRLTLFGQSKEIQAAGSFDSLAGASVADLMQREDVAGLRKDRPASTEGLTGALDASSAVTSLFPASELAFTLLRLASADHALTPELETQLGDVLKFVRSAADTPAAVTAVQESIMPVYQLARRCRTVAEFETILRHCRSIEQIKIMTRIAAAGASNARVLTQVLTIAGSSSDSPAPAIIEHVLRYGQPGLDTVWYLGRKGAAGLTFAVRHPDLTVESLHKGGARTLLPAGMMRAWTHFRERSPAGALLSKYTMFTLFCLLLLTTLVPMGGGAATGETAGPAQPSARYWGLVVSVSLMLSVVIFVGSMATHRPSESAVRLNLSTQGQPPVAEADVENSAISTGLIMACVVAMQGFCWLLAHQRVRRIEADVDAPAAVRSKRLDNMDIFFDLPLYFGLGGTILSFILITTFGVGMARFLAYSSTLVGIIVSVILRLAYLYPLRERLTTEGRG